ncbi:MAG: hypothetical protein JO316_05400 [Abitibacteriaceae bacterium]|nr:hypothetical protein [Abditibacteriaceae bacterium]
MPALNQFLAAVGGLCLLLAFGRAAAPPLAASARRAYYPYTAAGRQESCLNNLRSLSMALATYAQDNDGRYPFLDSQDAGERRVTWVSILGARAANGSPEQGAVPNQLLCPAGPAVPGRGTGAISSYGMNPVLAAAKSQEVEEAATAILLADRGTKHDVALLPPYPSWPAYSARSAGSGFDPTACNFDFRHGGESGDAPATGVTYADGHAGALTPGDWAAETSTWGGSAVLRLARDRLLRRRPETSALLQRLQADDVAGSASYLSGHRAALKPVSGDVLALWRLNSGEHASASVDRLGWNLAQSWRLAGDAALERQCDAEETRRCQAELQRVNGGPWEQRTTQGQPNMSCQAPNAWTLENEQEGRYRRLYFRSSIPALYALIEVGTRAAFITPQPIHWDGDERDLQRHYGRGNYRRLAMTTGSLQGHEAGLWEYEVQKPGGPRLHKRLLGYTDGWNSYVLSTTAPAKDWALWQPAFDKMVDSASIGG